MFFEQSTRGSILYGGHPITDSQLLCNQWNERCLSLVCHLHKHLVCVCLNVGSHVQIGEKVSRGYKVNSHRELYRSAPQGQSIFVTSFFFAMQYLEDLNDLTNLMIRILIEVSPEKLTTE